MTSKDINGTDGKVHFTGGPFYGPYGVTGITNENETDETDRKAQVNPHFDIDGNNHFGESGKGYVYHVTNVQQVQQYQR